VPAEDDNSSSPSIEDIIAQAAETSGVELKTVDEVEEKPLPAPTFVASRSTAPVAEKPSFLAPRREPSRAPATNSTIVPAAAAVVTGAAAPRIEPNLGSAALARQPATEPVIIDNPPVEEALSAIREVELENDETLE